jgi:hypothetical protein
MKYPLRILRSALRALRWDAFSEASSDLAQPINRPEANQFAFGLS